MSSAPIVLRDYQQASIDAVYDHLRARQDNPCVVIPTGGGKTPIIAQICSDAVTRWSGRVLVVAHVKELLQQTADKLATMAPDLMFGVYSAGLGSRDTEHNVIIGGIQSIYKRAFELGKFDLILIDEAHMIPDSGEGMYRTLLAEARQVNPNVRVIGLTATPYRMGTGWICSPDNILNDICYEISVLELIKQGFICPLKSKNGKREARADTSRLHVRGGEYIESEVQAQMDTSEMVDAAVKDIIRKTKDRKHVLIFCPGVDHAKHVAADLRKATGADVCEVYGDMLPGLRSYEIERLLMGESKYMVNVNVLTTGFDAPHIDAVVILRPTNSPGFYYQMVGRGFRISPDKDYCLVLDYGDNVMRHGPVDAVEPKQKGEGGGEGPPMRECPQCGALILAAYLACPECEYVFDRNPNHSTQASEEEVLSSNVTKETYNIKTTYYYSHRKAGAWVEGRSTPTMRVEYSYGFNSYVKEWVCFEHTGYAREKAVKWWKSRSDHPVPDTVAEAVDLANQGALADTERINVTHTPGKLDKVTKYWLGKKPELPETDDAYDGDGFDWETGTQGAQAGGSWEYGER